MVKDSRKRALEQLAFLFWKKNKNRSSKENWKKAEKLLNWLKNRYKDEK